MKKLILTVTATLVCVAAFAQGKVQFVNDSLHIVYYSTSTRPGDAGLAGRGPGGPTGNMPTNVTLVVDLYEGTSSSSLAFAASTTFSTVQAGEFGPQTVNFTGTSAGTTGFFQVQVRDNAFANATAAQTGNSYYGFSQIFTAVGASIVPNSLVQHTAPANSTWADGTFDASAIAGSGAKGALSVGVVPVPEPSTFVLAGLGAAALLVFRRRK